MYVWRQLVLFTLDILEGGDRGPFFRVSMDFAQGVSGRIWVPPKANLDTLGFTGS
jgi:hypothetical protein